MYPYHQNSRRYETTIRAKERTSSQKQSASLTTDRRLQELFMLARQEAEQTAKKWEAFLQQAEHPDIKTFLKPMYLDSKKHQRLLREVCFTLFSTPEEPPTLSCTPPTDAAFLLEDLLKTELDDIAFYRELLFAMPKEEPWNALFRILTDKQNHLSALNYLYAKYFSKTSGN